MGKWTVRRFPAAHRPGGFMWCAVSPWINNTIGRVAFPRPSWREALDYANRKAREGWEADRDD